MEAARLPEPIRQDDPSVTGTHRIDSLYYGWGKDKPRKEFPKDLPKGAVVEVHGGPYNFKNFTDKMAIVCEGTKNRPVFFRGIDSENRPKFIKDLCRDLVSDKNTKNEYLDDIFVN